MIHITWCHSQSCVGSGFSGAPRCDVKWPLSSEGRETVKGQAIHVGRWQFSEAEGTYIGGLFCGGSMADRSSCLPARSLKFI